MNPTRTTESTRSGPWSGLALVAAMLVGAVLIFSAITKMISPKAFVASVESYGVLPPSLVLPGATGLIGLEVALGLMLILGPGRRTAAWITVPLVLMFIGMVSYAMRAGLEDCGCFGEVVKMQPSHELILDFVLLALTALVVWRGQNLDLGSPLVAPTLGWGGLALGAALFLAGGPVASSQATLDVDMQDLAVLEEANPPLDLGEDAFLFFFSADCDHCWAYAGAVQLMHDRVEGLPVHAVTFSDPLSLAAFEEAFEPSYPIHIIDRAAFDGLLTEYPAAVWIQAGGVSQTWAGYVPSHRQIVEAGGYFYRETPPEEETPAPAASGALPDFGGTVGTRH